MTDAELQTVREKLNPYFVPFAQKPKNYKVTNSRKTQPDMWVKDVSKSVVLQVCLTTQLTLWAPEYTAYTASRPHYWSRYFAHVAVR
jgi:hypothetical protein